MNTSTAMPFWCERCGLNLPPDGQPVSPMTNLRPPSALDLAENVASSASRTRPSTYWRPAAEPRNEYVTYPSPTADDVSVLDAAMGDGSDDPRRRAPFRDDPHPAMATINGDANTANSDTMAINREAPPVRAVVLARAEVVS
jgi:hypothetical protein